MTIENQLGDLIYYRRTCLGLTLEEVAKATGVSKGTLSRWERGQLKMSVNHLIALCKTLDVTPAEILAEIKEPQGGKMK